MLRTASNYTMQYPGATAQESLAKEKLRGGRGYTAYLPALEAAWLIGSPVVEELVDGWDLYQDRLPSTDGE